MPRGFRKCSAGCLLEHEAEVRRMLERHQCVSPGSVRRIGEHVEWTIDLSVLPDGDAPAVELVLRREIERIHARMGPPTEPPPPDEAAQ